MRVTRRRSLILVLLLNPCVVFPPVPGQANTVAAGPAAADPARRQKAVALFVQGKRLEALPLLQELAEQNPQDAELLVALAASLIDHAATLSDPEAAGKERLHAADLVKKAWELGDTSPLGENLRQLLGELPADGALKFSANPAVEQVMNASEAAFARRDFDAALRDYAQALELEPANYSAVLFTGNTYDRKNDFAQASVWYERAIRLDPNVETAYRYYADMLAKQGDMVKSRSLLIHAAVAEPYNKIVWREIRAWAIINNTAFNIVYVGIPRPPKGAPQSQRVSSAWSKYYSVRADWQTGGKFHEQFPQEAGYRHSLLEESEALTAAAKTLEKLKRDQKTHDSVAGDPVAGLLLKLHEAGLIDPYVLFSLGDDELAKDYEAYRSRSRAKLENYLDQFVMPRVAARQ
jgi:tetratricopeptide (TPR) repeat protein